jgi:hypothetical protein
MYYLFNEIETQSGLESSLEIALIVTDINRVRARIAWSAELQWTNLSDLYFNLISKCSISNSTEEKRHPTKQRTKFIENTSVNTCEKTISFWG